MCNTSPLPVAGRKRGAHRRSLRARSRQALHACACLCVFVCVCLSTRQHLRSQQKLCPHQTARKSTQQQLTKPALSSDLGGKSFSTRCISSSFRADTWVPKWSCHPLPFMTTGGRAGGSGFGTPVSVCVFEQTIASFQWMSVHMRGV